MPGASKLALGDAARALLAQPSFVAAWQALEQACPWTTPFQRASFATTWYTSYAGVATPLLVFRQDSAGVLRAIFPLALLDDGKRLTVAGAEQAEYQGWLALPTETEFIVAALNMLKQATPASRLTLQYLPPGIPLQSLDSDATWSRRLFRQSVSRSLMRLDPQEMTKTLRKSGNRSKFNRLKQLGAVRLERLTERTALARVIDDIAAYCDLRQCAISGVMPFRDDPRKKDFHLHLLEHPGLLHATVLFVGDRVAAAHLGMAGSRDVALGVIAHSPFLAAHSPGKLLILLLGDRLAAEGFEYLDLTPTGAYKERFASDADTVEVRDIYLRPQALRARLIASGRRVAKQAVVATGRMMGLSEVDANERVRRLRAELRHGQLSRLPRRIISYFRATLYRRTESLLYRLPATVVRTLEREHITLLSRDSVDDLCHYRPAEPSDASRQHFARAAIERLEAGQHVYTLVEDGKLIHYAWLIEEQQTSVGEFGQPYKLEPRSCVIYNDYTHPSAHGRGLQKISLAQRAMEALEFRPTDWVVVSVLADDASSRRNIEGLGFRRCAVFVREVRFGRVRLS